MERKARLLLEIVIIALLASIALTYLRTMVFKDFYIVKGKTAETGLLDE